MKYGKWGKSEFGPRADFQPAGRLLKGRTACLASAWPSGSGQICPGETARREQCAQPWRRPARRPGHTDAAGGKAAGGGAASMRTTSGYPFAALGGVRLTVFGRWHSIGRRGAHRIWPTAEARLVAETVAALELPGGPSVTAPTWEGNGVRSRTGRRSQIGGRCGGKAARQRPRAETKLGWQWSSVSGKKGEGRGLGLYSHWTGWSSGEGQPLAQTAPTGATAGSGQWRRDVGVARAGEKWGLTGGPRRTVSFPYYSNLFETDSIFNWSQRAFRCSKNFK
jgi:hypothetical protein